MAQAEMIKAVIGRANEMLKDQKINEVYQSFSTLKEAKNWLIKAALATLIIPINERVQK